MKERIDRSARAVVLGLGMIIACASTPARDEPGLDRLRMLQTDSRYVDPLIRFPPGFSIGTTLYGSASIETTAPAARRQLERAAQSGMQGFTYYLDWPDLEPAPATYDFSELEANLDALEERGLSPLINLTLIDIEDLILPSDLLLEDDLLPGLRLNDPRLESRLAGLLDQLLPILEAHEAWFLGFGNEMDALFETRPELLDDYVELVQFAVHYTEQLAPALTTGVVVTTSAVLENRPTFLALQEAGILTGMNYAPIRQSDFTVLPTEHILQDFRLALSRFDGKPVIIQELTCPNAVTMGGDQAWQAQCMAILLDEIAIRPEVRFASVFTLVDFEGAFCELIQTLFLAGEDGDVPQALFDRLAEYLCTMGVLDGQGEPKPAWESILQRIPALTGRNRTLRPGDHPGLRQELLK